MKAIAIVSAGIRFPGARNLDEFEQLLDTARDASVEVDDRRWIGRDGRSKEGVFHRRAYRTSIESASPLGLALDAELLDTLDPLFHLALNTVREALYGARFERIDRQRLGLILGNIALPTEASTELASRWLARAWGLGEKPGTLANENLRPAALPALIAARALSIEGPAFTLDAACASSLYALDLACDELEEGRLDMVLAGGLSRPDGLYTQVGFSALDALSRSGRSYPLDDRADGLMVGEGAGVFALKRLEDAEAHGDRILAVIRGSGLSNDRQGGLLAPSTEGQLRAMRAAYAEAGWAEDSAAMIECHATGTPLGDATEIKSLQELRAAAGEPQAAVLGSVKSSVGHMLTAAGAAGIAKILLAFRAQKFWGTANFKAAPASWSLASHKLRVLSQSEAWPSPDRARRAAISGFGFGGINAHLLLEEHSPSQTSAAKARLPQSAPRRVALIKAADLSGEAHDAINIAYKQFRIPPKELQSVLPQQLWPLLAIDALGPVAAELKAEAGCFVGIELDAVSSLYATRWQLQDKLPDLNLDPYRPALEANQVMGALPSIVASRIARELQLGGPSFPVAEAEASGLRALELAARAIARGDIPAAFVAAVDMGTSHRAQAQNQSIGVWPEAEDCAAALLLVEFERAVQLGLKIQAVFSEALTLEHEDQLALDDIPLWVEDSRRDSGWLRTLPTRDIRLLEIRKSRGAAHGLSALLNALAAQSGERFQFLFRSERLHHLRFEDCRPLSLSRFPALHSSGFIVQRSDRQLPALEELLPRAPEFSPMAPASPSSVAAAPMPATIVPENISESQTPRAVAESQSVRSQPAVSPVTSPAALDLIDRLMAAESETVAAHKAFLAFRAEGDRTMREILLQDQGGPAEFTQPASYQPEASQWVEAPLNSEPALYDYAACTRFAEGQIQTVFGEAFAEVDRYPTRVRLPAERLLLCHRVMSITGEAKSLGSGTMVTEHDVFGSAWYLDGPFMPTSIAVESGQADLMLSAWLGADFKTRGEAVYRLLDAKVTFHGPLPTVGETIRYEIQVKRFFEQGGTLFFQFAFEATANGRPLMSMKDGCAGFFTEEALAAGRGVQRSQLQLASTPGRITGGWKALTPLPIDKISYDDAALDALRAGDLAGAFGPAFSGLSLRAAKALPSGDMRLVHRIPEFEATGGRFGLGRILGEADIHPDDWFLTCHFIDDQVMPGTLMYECCLHTLRVFLMRAGWVGEADDFHAMPLPGVSSQLKCRGQVLASTQKVSYEIEIKEIGYGPDAYVICDALMYADGRAIVDITNMSLSFPGHSKERFEALWANVQPLRETQPLIHEPAYSYEDILAFSSGKPSDCFGPVYTDFDGPRKIARLPRPPFQFLDSVDWVEGPFMKQHVGTTLLAHYELPDDAWYWALNNDSLPFAVLVEIALQPCGFMAAYMGSALTSTRDLKFRNLSGEAVQHQSIRRGSGRLSIEVASTKIARSGDMIIQDYSFRVFNAQGDVYVGATSFGFFTDEALAEQAGIRGADRFKAKAMPRPYTETSALPQGAMRMLETWTETDGRLWGEKRVNPEEWFFEAHFFEDPVMPGSLGLEALEQLLQLKAHALWPEAKAWRVALGKAHQWMYRGQVRRHNRLMQLELKAETHAPQSILADGLLYCDGLPIYKLENLALEPLED